ncbi:ABC transporter permease [Saccharicrinis sp. FJH62]|uniref:ABC transporter permease n=1 Tax=Saccharicrinis sp. FJH62 TaxID=3344657 RepID=UPI0035D45D52
MRNTLKIFLRTLQRKKVYSIINIGGYAISMAVVFIIVSFVIQEVNTDKSFRNIDRIYRIKQINNNAQVPQTLRNDVKETIPEVQKICLYNVGDITYKKAGERQNMKVISTDDDFINMFSFRFIYQSKDPTLSVKENIILTKTLSEKLYGLENPIGKTIDIGDQAPLTIVGVVNDLPSNSSFGFEALVSSEMRIGRHYIGYNQEQHVMYKALIMLSPGSNPENVNELIKNKLERWQAFKDEKLSIQSFQQVYFDTETQNDGLNHANKSMIYLLSVISLVILFMTIFNYVNMTVSGGLERMKEIGIKRTSGASKTNIFRQILSESLFTTLLSMIIAVILAIILAPLFASFINIHLDFNILISQPRVIFSGVLLFLLTGIIAGIYPATVLSRTTPLKNLSKTKFSIDNRKGLVMAFQFVITCALIMSLLVIHKQLEFIKNKDLGFDQEKILKLRITGMPPQDRESFKNELSSFHSISAISSSTGSPMDLTGSTSGSFDVNGEQKQINSKQFSIDQDFIPMFNIKIVQGRNFIDSDIDHNTQLINEHLFKALGWNNISDKKLFGRKVVGVVKDFNYENLYTDIGNLILTKEPGIYANHLNIKISGDIGSTMDFIKNTYKKFSPEIPISYQFYDDWIQRMYEREENQAKAINLFTIIAIIISCLGLIGLIEDATTKRIKEIGIRKVNGAEISEILVMLNKSFVKWVVIAFVIATPIAWYVMNKWLEKFAYKTALSWWIFALAGVMALGIALITVSFRSWKAATKNPVEALRYE